jgi:hypothetical protein
MRIYLPATLPRLAAALDEGSIVAEVAYAVTPALREWYVEGDIDQLEYVAAGAAARASLQLLAQAPADHAARRVVIAADVADSDVRPAADLGRAAVRLRAPVTLQQIVSAHVDETGAADDVRRAVVALPAADAGDEDAIFTVDSVEDHELAWYAAQELGVLVELET